MGLLLFAHSSICYERASFSAVLLDNLVWYRDVGCLQFTLRLTEVVLSMPLLRYVSNVWEIVFFCNDSMVASFLLYMGIFYKPWKVL